MSPGDRSGVSAGLAVICGVATGALTNMVTAAWTPSLRWTLTLLGALIVVVTVWVGLEVRRAGRDDGAAGAVSIRQRVRVVSGRLVGMRGDAGDKGVQVDQKARKVEKGAEAVGYDARRQDRP